MQILSKGDNVRENSKPCLWEIKKNIKVSPANVFTQRTKR